MSELTTDAAKASAILRAKATEIAARVAARIVQRRR